MRCPDDVARFRFIHITRSTKPRPASSGTVFHIPPTRDSCVGAKAFVSFASNPTPTRHWFSKAGLSSSLADCVVQDVFGWRWRAARMRRYGDIIDFDFWRRKDGRTDLNSSTSLMDMKPRHGRFILLQVLTAWAGILVLCDSCTPGGCSCQARVPTAEWMRQSLRVGVSTENHCIARQKQPLRASMAVP